MLTSEAAPAAVEPLLGDTLSQGQGSPGRLGGAGAGDGGAGLSAAQGGAFGVNRAIHG